MIMSFQSEHLRAATLGDRVEKGDGEDMTQRDGICAGFKSALKSRPVPCEALLSLRPVQRQPRPMPGSCQERRRPDGSCWLSMRPSSHCWG